MFQLRGDVIKEVTTKMISKKTKNLSWHTSQAWSKTQLINSQNIYEYQYFWDDKTWNGTTFCTDRPIINVRPKDNPYIYIS
jgi:hypothetical protein